MVKKYQNKKRFFLNIFRDRQPQLIKDGGWHFSFLKDPKSIKKKIISYSHQEYNKDEFINIKNIENKILNNRDLFNRDIKYKSVDVDNTFPDYILKNKNKFKDWIA